MFGLGAPELLIILVVALLVFGPEKLPEIGQQVGKAIREFRQIQNSLQSQLRDVIDASPGPVVPPTGPAPAATSDAPSDHPAARSVPESFGAEHTETLTAKGASSPVTGGWPGDHDLRHTPE